MRRAKIIATIGPATESYASILGLVAAGVDVARLDLTQGDHAFQEQAYAHVRRASEETGRAVGILADLRGDRGPAGAGAVGAAEARGGVRKPALDEKEEADLRWALRLGVDLVALSDIHGPGDAHRPHVVMAEEGIEVPLIAKIDTPQAIDRLQDIIDAFEGVMVARGTLGSQLPLEAVPIAQKRAIELARRWAKPVIVATHMLESMITQRTPTRAETSDVANAVLDGADAVMLSGETAVGAHPIIVVETMQSIIASTEEHGLERIPPLGTKPHTQAGAITLAAVEVAEFVQAKYLCVFSQSGDSARRMSRLRHPIPIIAFTDLPASRAHNALLWGVQTFLVPRMRTTDELVDIIDKTLLESGLAEPEDRIVMTAGAPPGIAGSTNNLRVHVIGRGASEAE